MSSESLKIYMEAEEKNVNMIQKVRKFVIIGQLTCYVPDILVPIFYLILGSPEPDQWALSFPVKWILLVANLKHILLFEMNQALRR